MLLFRDFGIANIVWSGHTVSFYSVAYSISTYDKIYHDVTTRFELGERMSVDVSEFEKKRDEILQMENEAEWKLSKSFEHSVLYRRIDNDSVYKCVRNMIGMPKEDCVKLFTDFNIRKRYDTYFSEMKVLEDAGEYKIVYWYSQFPFPCSDRDMHGYLF